MRGIGEMRIIDVDSHFIEPKDWLAEVDPGLVEMIGPSDENFIERVVEGVVGDLLDDVPMRERPQNLTDLLAPAGRRSLMKLMDASASQADEASPAGYDGTAR